MKFSFNKQHENWKPVSLLPLVAQMKGYSTSKLGDDLRAGFNVAVLSFPVNMAYALVAGLPISFGIFSGIIASLIGLIFCRSVYITFGPSNATAVMLLSSFAAGGLLTETARIEALPNILLMVGIFMIAMSVFKLTFFISYISRMVIIGHITSSALLIFVNQMRNLLGFSYADGLHPITLIDTICATAVSIKDTKIESLIIAIATLAIFFPLKKFAKKLPAEGITLILVGIVCYVCVEFFGINIDRLSTVSVDSWNFTVPDFSIFGIKESASCALAITLLATIEAFSIGKSLASQRADRLDTNQEMFALGMANVGCAFGSSTLASGSLTRSTLAINSNAQTSLFNLFTAIFTIIAVLLFGGAVEYVPKSTLALIVVYTSVTLIKPAIIKIALKSTWSDAIVFTTTFLTGVCSTLDNAIFAGVAVSILCFLRKASEPEVIEYAIGDDGELEKIGNKTARSEAEVSIVHVEGNMFFGASDVIQNQIRRISAEPNMKVLILKLRNAINFDATSVLDIEELNRRLKKSNRTLMMCEVREPIMKVLKKSGLYNQIGADNIFENDEDNPTLSAARAIKSAQKYITKGGVSIYASAPVEK
ncbi:MAG: SulP family inorganic anion transporter [Opitutales bacterium]|nr:SulP family inorganic anion transporter [Opitutales bacterium]